MKLDDEAVARATTLAVLGVIAAVRLGRAVERSRAGKASKVAALGARYTASVVPPAPPAVRPEPPVVRPERDPVTSGGGTHREPVEDVPVLGVRERPEWGNPYPRRDGRWDQGPVVHPKGGANDPR